MTDKTKLKTRPPSSQFLEETKPPEFVPRARAKKNRAWYRPDEEEIEATPAAAPVPAAPVIVQEENPKPVPPPVRLTPAAPEKPKAEKKAIRPALPSEKSKIAEATIVPPMLQKPVEQAPPPVQISVAPSIEEVALPRQGATAQPISFESNSSEKTTASLELEPLPLVPMNERAQALISRAKSGCPHEYLFRQIMMFEMSNIDPSQEFGTLALSRNGLEQLFGISEGGVKKAKREMEAYKLISTVCLGTRGSPTVFKIFSPYKILES